MGYRADANKTLFHYIVGQGMILKDCVYQSLRRSCIYRNHGFIDMHKMYFDVTSSEQF